MTKHFSEEFEGTPWQDEYISFDKGRGHFVCWDERGEFIDTADTVEEARMKVDTYAKDRWGNT